MLQGLFQVSNKRDFWETDQRHALQGCDPALDVVVDLFPFGVFPPDGGGEFMQDSPANCVPTVCDWEGSDLVVCRMEGIKEVLCV